MRNQKKRANTAPKPLSLRLNREQRETLEKEANGLPISTYIKLRLFGRLKNAKDTRIRRRVVDLKEICRLIAFFGESGIAEKLDILAEAEKSGSLYADPDTDALIHKMAQDFETMRDTLLRLAEFRG